MGRKRNYRIFTFDALELMRICSRMGRRFDLNSQYDMEKILADESKFAECALFYQILRVAKDKGDKRPRREIITKSLVYLDFGKGIKGFDDETKALLTDGFEVRFKGDKDYTKFCAFDKSASMSRNNTISFISEALFDDVDEALDVGIDRTKVKLIPSKYYAYRGLYMTDGVAVEPDRLELNEKTVIVIKNKGFSLDKQFAIKISDETNNEGKIDVSDSRIEITNKFDVTPYDGEGIISPLYAGIINRELGRTRGNDPTSFQIRMPFTKGMLHTVDYMQFMNDWFSGDFPESLEVTDVFGIRRKLKDAQIILTSSMFKCWRWLDAMLGIYEQDPETGKEVRAGFTQDPMKFFFDNFEKYDHALYIANTDAGIRSNNQMKMNYQFLNTLDLDKDDFEKLVESHISDTQSILKNPFKGRKALLAVDEDEVESIDGYRIKQMEPWEYALRTNVAFIKDPMIRDRLRQAAKGRINDILRGRIVVDGTVKYLSGDLLDFLLYLAECCNVGTDGIDTISHLRQFTLKGDRFYVAGMTDYGMDQTKYYGVLRSPHLSRNEQCALRPYASNLYNKYFNQIKGIVMVSNRSNAPAAMSGADFDGDLVKIVTNDVINEAILRAVYEQDPEGEPDSLGVIPYRRKLPIPVISSPVGDERYIGDHISFKDLKASFTSRVGMISNLAIKMGKNEYSGSSDVPENSAALCTIATGLEIDSVKNGINPEISKLEDLCHNNRDVYLDINNKFKQISRDAKRKNKTVHVAYDEEKDEYTAFFQYERKNNPTEELFRISGRQTHNIDWLPYYYAKALYEGKAAGRIRLDPDIKIPEHRFSFELFDNWREETLKDPRIPELMGIIGAYRRLVADARNISFAESQISEGTLRGRVITLLDVEYEKDIDILMRSGECIEEALESAYQEVYAAVKTKEQAKELLELVDDLNWQYTMSFDEKAALLAELLETDDLSMAALEIICDRYDNGYQILNYILREVMNLRELEALQTDDSGNDDEDDTEEVTGGKWRKICNKELFAEIFGEYRKYYTKSDYTKTDWLEDAGEKCRDKVLELFTYVDEKGKESTDIDLAIQCTAALDKQLDEKHSFLWGVFHAEDFRGVVYR